VHGNVLKISKGQGRCIAC